MIVEAGAAETVGSRIDPRPVLIVTGLVQEARIAAGPGMIVICSSSDPQQLRELLATLDPTTFRGVISFGVAGGLDPSLKSGDVVVATEVMSGDTRFLAASALNEEMIASAALKRRRIVRGGLAGVEEVIAAKACKAALRSMTGAAAVDMESHIAAAYAAKAGIPFAALRVISDPAHRALPELAKSAVKPNGDIDLRKVLRGIARNPRIPRFRRSALDDGRSSGRHGEPYRGGLCRQSRHSVRRAARNQRSRAPGATGTCEVRGEAERRHRPAQGAARHRPQSTDAARAGVDRYRL
ncbi:adenosylhomocysteine nucleosidase [Bradyrhizobium sp. USDA 3262]